MSVYTVVTPEQLRVWLGNYALGELHELKGIASGITNTNYFITTDSGRYVLTLFEHSHREELLFSLNLMACLADRDIPCPRPVANYKNEFHGILNGKPAALVTCLPGVSIDLPEPAHCAAVGRLLGRMHLAGASFPETLQNPRGPDWHKKTARAVLPKLADAERIVLAEELGFQSEQQPFSLPRGIIHADLFRDNVLFDGDRLGGVIDFYYACNDVLLYDLAIAANDWCVLPDGGLDWNRLLALLRAYHAERPLLAEERSAWPTLLRAGALRFWLSRQYDSFFPKQGEMAYSKNPARFLHILKARKREEDQIRQLWI